MYTTRHTWTHDTRQRSTEFFRVRFWLCVLFFLSPVLVSFGWSTGNYVMHCFYREFLMFHCDRTDRCNFQENPEKFTLHTNLDGLLQLIYNICEILLCKYIFTTIFFFFSFLLRFTNDTTFIIIYTRKSRLAIGAPSRTKCATYRALIH